MTEDRKNQAKEKPERQPKKKTEDKKLVLSTKRSIHPPIEIEIDGETYYNQPLSRALFEKLKEYEDAALAGDIEAFYTQVRLIYGLPKEVLNKIDVRDIQTLLDYTMTKVFSTAEAQKTEAEKEEKKG